MLRKIQLSFLFVLTITFSQAQKDSIFLRSVYDAALTSTESYEHLRYLCFEIGHRLSGSPQITKAEKFTSDLLVKYGATLKNQEVKVPHWERGAKEYGEIILENGKSRIQVEVLALGGSLSTPKSGITAPIIEFKSLDALKVADASTIKGKVVYVSGAMDPKNIVTFTSYGATGPQRYHGPSIAASKGAVAYIVRSLSMGDNPFPHTGVLIYNDSLGKVPAAAISTQTATDLSQMIAEGKKPSFHLRMNCKEFPDATNYNVIGEIKGSEFPDEIILVGGHLDSWDVGHGAHDDGGPCLQAVEVLRIFKELNYQPKRTIRVVLFANEESGLRGATAYAKASEEQGLKHIAAIESDRGVFTPRGFDFVGEKGKKLYEWKSLFSPYLVSEFGPGYGGADIKPLEKQGTTLFGYVPDSQRYFDFHHTAADVFEAVNMREMQLGSAAITSLVYLLDQHGLD